MRFVLYAVRVSKNLLLLFVERVFVAANGAGNNSAEADVIYVRHGNFNGTWRQSKPFPAQELTQHSQVSEFAERRHNALRNQMLHGGMR